MLPDPVLAPPSGPPSFSQRLGRGLGGGALLALFYTVWVAGLRLTAGTGPFRALGVSFPHTVALYWGTGLLGGFLVATLPQLRQTRAGRTALAFLMVLPATGGIAWTQRSDLASAFNVTGGPLLIAVLGVGALMAMVMAFLLRSLVPEPDTPHRIFTAPHDIPGGTTTPAHRRILGGG